MTAEEVKLLPTAEKLQIMEAIWEDMRNRFDAIELSPEDKALLDERRARVRDGRSSLLDWDEAKSQIGKA